ncbi:MAG TPA: YraN family protein [Dermatophilaceae bacterium]|nr:YraN family protein [Dermatophilaceae bacterium]
MAVAVAGKGDARGALGRYGERLAARYLTERGLVLVDRNWRCPHGELDLVAMDGSCLVACEVKTRRGVGFGSPVEAVTAVKALRLRRLVGLWLAQHHDLVGDVADLRVDVVGILRPPRGPAQVEHLVGVA